MTPDLPSPFSCLIMEETLFSPKVDGAVSLGLEMSDVKSRAHKSPMFILGTSGLFLKFKKQQVGVFVLMVFVLPP